MLGMKINQKISGTLFTDEERPCFYTGDEPESGLNRDLDDRLQFRNVPLGTSCDLRK